jgi:hypothetical protein
MSFERIVNVLSICSAEMRRQIDADIHRTVNPAEDVEWTPEMTLKLRRVLMAYAAYNPGLGYCQGLNYVVARLLQHVETEEHSFWLLERMIALLPPDYYTTMVLHFSHYIRIRLNTCLEYKYIYIYI